MAAELKRLTLQRQQKLGFKLNASKEMKKVETFLLPNSPASRDDCCVSVKKLENYRKTIKELDDEIMLCIEDESELSNEVVKSIEFDDSLIEVVEKLNLRVQRLDSPPAPAPAVNETANSSSSSSSHNASVKLPKLQIAKFSGDALKWQEFWDCYENSIHSNADLSAVDKFAYLKSYLDGDAERVALGYSMTSANYDVVVDALKVRFGNPQVAVFSHFESMLALSTATNEFAQLQKVFDDCESHIRSLVALGLPEETFGQVFTPIVLSKLPKNVRMELHRKNGMEPWTLSKLRELLRKEIYAQDMSQRTLSLSSSSTSSANGGQNGKFGKNRSQSKPTHMASTTSSLVAPNKSVECDYCSEAHYSDKCSKYPDVGSRRLQLKDRCLSCLRSGHVVRECRSKRPCFYCKKDSHHRSLCTRKFGSKPSQPKSSDSVMQVSGTNVAASTFVPSAATGTAGLLSHGEQTILQTAIADVRGVTVSKSARLLMDTGCSRSFVSTRLCQQMGARYKGEEQISIAGFADSRRKTIQYKIFEFDVQLKSGGKTTVTANATDVITCPVHKVPIDPKKNPIVTVIPLAEPLVSESQLVEIDILIGGDYYYDFVGSEQIKCSDGLVLLQSSLGYIAAGRLESKSEEAHRVSSLLIPCDPIPSSNFDLERFWKLEDIGIVDQATSEDDDVALQQFNKSIRFNGSRYEVKWPWKQDHPELADNYHLARGRLKSLMKKLVGNPETLAKYDKTIRDQIDKGIVESAPEQPDGVTYYIPHHCVITPEKVTTKLRVVYDASSKSSKSDVSLNECIHRGPVMLADLCGLLLRFRLSPIALVSDIEKAFLQVVLQKPDRDVTRFLWVKDVSKPLTESNVIALRFTRVPFGAKASPFLLSGTVCHHLNQSDSPVSDEIADNNYVDNIFSGKDNVDDALKYYHEAKDVFNAASMNLREWYCNNPDVMARIHDKDRGSGSTIKVLGILWNLEDDSLKCSVGKSASACVATKRQFMKAIASVFDPCGWFAPITVTGKIVLQEIWKRKYDWDVIMPDDLIQQVKPALSSIAKIPEFSFPRWCIPLRSQESTSNELHCFTDASAKAYSAVVYLRIASSTVCQVSLLFSKCRVSPLKTLTIPKLELMAIVIGTRILSFVEKQLKLPISRKVLWSDSQCALHWVLGKEVSTVFVRNRVREIRKCPEVKFEYVPTEDNPADLPSRGMNFETFSTTSLWWQGPKWLQLDDANWPTTDQKFGPQLKDDVPSSEAEVAMPADGRVHRESAIDAERFSSLNRLLRVTSWVRRFTNNARNIYVRSGGLAAEEVNESRSFWEKEVQRVHLTDISFKPPSPLVHQLSLFVDESGLIRCAGRFQYSDLPDEAKYPILLPKNTHITHLIILDYHSRLCHAGVKDTLAKLRSRYWLPSGRCEVKRVRRSCLFCRKMAGGPFRIPTAPPLPDFRSTRRSPFSHVGVDYLGPLYLRTPESGSECKVWICLFTCAVVRAIHLEVIEDLSAAQFLLCLRRFSALYGPPSLIVSDNAKQFHTSHKVLQKLWHEVCSSKEVQVMSSQNGIQWKFITEKAPWMGGFYERMVGITKQSLKRSLDRRLVTLVELQTVVAEVSSIVNSRPLVYQEDEVGDSPLTPGHFLLRCHPGFQCVTDSDEFQPNPRQLANSLMIYWKRISAVLDTFWKMWQSHYLLSLREQWQKVKQRDTSELLPEVGTVVLMKDNLPRAQWKMGLITECIRSSDGACRSVKLRIANGHVLTRPIKLLCPLEISSACCQSNSSVIRDALPNSAAQPARPSRAAAKVARQTIKRVVTSLNDSEDDESQ